jgi:glycosyltransferase involved in cell wall biosynthesis
MKNKVLIIIPAYNETGNLPSLLEEINHYQDLYDAVVIDDASTDQTAQIAQSYNVPVIRLAANLGIGGAVQAGFKYAVRNSYDITVQVDGDGQHNPGWIEQLLKPIVASEVDCVIGSRYMKKDPDRDYDTPLVRRIGMIFSTTILFLATGKIVTDTTSGFRALNYRSFEFFAREYPVDHPEAETLLMLHQAKFRFKEIPVKMRGRKSGRSLFTTLKAIQYPFRVLVGFLGILLKGSRN